jgi:hypothetical protein
MTENERLLSLLNDEYGDGSDSPLDMLQAAMRRDVCPGICTKCEATYEDVEPDTTTYWCEHCNENSVISCLILAGLI